MRSLSCFFVRENVFFSKLAGSPDIQVVTAPELDSSSSNQQDRAAPNIGATRTIRRMNSFEALQHAFGRALRHQCEPKMYVIW